MIGPGLRAALLFGAVAGLGLALAALLGRGPAAPEGGRPNLPVVVVPPGTDLPGAAGIPGVSLVDARGVVASEVREVLLDDGSRVPFRPSLLRSASERPLPAPAPGVRRVALSRPDLLLLPLPKTRQEYEDSAKVEPTRLTAPEGILDQGPGDASTIHLRGGFRMETERKGARWVFAGEEAVLRLPSRALHASGPVTVESPELRARGVGLEASDAAGSIRITERATGTVTRPAGARLGGSTGSGEIRFSCTEPLEILQLPGPGDRHRITLQRDAVLDQGDGRLAAPRIEIDLAPQPRTDAPAVEAIRGSGGAVLTGGKEGRDFVARGERLQARPQADGTTEVLLEGSPTLDLRETGTRRGERTLRVEGRGPARLLMPREAGDLAAAFRGGAWAILREGDPPVRREIRARTLILSGRREEGSARTEIRSLRAEGSAEMAEGDRKARADQIDWTPAAGGGSRTVLREDVTVEFPGAGALDRGAAPGSGMLLLYAPREAVLESPPDGDAARGSTLAVTGGAVLRRVVGEREIYRLRAGRIDATLHPGNRGIERLDATVDPRMQGREEGPGGRRYDFAGVRLTVLGSPGDDRPGTAEIAGTPGGQRGSASFVAEDGRPLSVAADALRMDRDSGAFHAEGAVQAQGLLPDPSAPRPASLACGSIDGVIERGAADGAARVRSFTARDGVTLQTAAETATGDRLDGDGPAGVASLHGAPARVVQRPPAGEAGLEDICEAPVLRVRLRDGRIEEARGEGGGRVVFHVPPAKGKEAAALERVEARCDGLLLHRPGSTEMAEDVVLVRTQRTGAGFEEKDRMEGADRLRLLHPPAPDGSAGRLSEAVAESDGADLEISSALGAWSASGVTRATLARAGDTVTLESSPRYPRFRVERKGGSVQAFRVVYDYVQRLFVEGIAATVEGGR